MMKRQSKGSSFFNRNIGSFPQPSLFLKGSVFTVLLLLLASFLWTLIFIKREREILFREKVSIGKMMLTHFATQAVLPLVEEDMIALNGLIKEAKEVDGALYAMILDRHQVIRAHTDPTQIGTPWKAVERIENRTVMGGMTSFTYRLPSGTEVLNLTKPISFMNKPLGSVSLGLSIDLLNHQMREEILGSIRKAFGVSLILMATGVGAVFFLVKWTTLPGRQENISPPEAVRNQVAVLYTGIREFKTYAGSRSPQEVFQDLSQYVSIATKAILEHEGFVIQVAGDTVVGIFQNAPLKEDHIQRAVRGAIAIQKSLENEKQQGNENPLLGKVGIGISSGVVLYGDIDSHKGKQDNYIGESFKAASSLYALAGPGEIVISKEVYKSIKHWVAVDPLPPREMTHRTEAWESFRLRSLVEREPHA